MRVLPFEYLTANLILRTDKTKTPVQSKLLLTDFSVIKKIYDSLLKLRLKSEQLLKY